MIEFSFSVAFTMKRYVSLLVVLLPLSLAMPLAHANEGKPALDPALSGSYVKSLTWRSVGPANMGGRITAISVFEADPSCFYVATASGGLLKTVDNGLTFTHQFDTEATVSIGDVCVAPSNKDIVWVGTGEANPRNSASYGDGVYKSTDGGKTWKNMGLKATFQIGKILIHPRNPDIVYVGALGRLYGKNAERGLFKTSDGGKSWNKILYFDDRTGVVDVIMHPSDPDTLIAAMWERRRDGFDIYFDNALPAPYHVDDPIVRFGARAGLYKTTNGGKTFVKVTKGLPTSHLGRIGIDWYRKDPKVVYAVVDCENIGAKGPLSTHYDGAARTGLRVADGDAGVRVTEIVAGSSGDKAGLLVDDVVLALDKMAIKSFAAYSAEIAKRPVGDKVAFSIKRDAEMMSLTVTLTARPSLGAGGPQRPFEAYWGGQRANIQDKQGPDGHEFGGVYRSDDGGDSWQRVNSLNPRPFYFSTIRVDPSNDQNVYVLGVAQHRSKNGGKTFSGDLGKNVHPDGHALWVDPQDGSHMIIGSDGGHYATVNNGGRWERFNTVAIGQYYHVAMSNKKPYWLYGGLQDNGSWGVPSVGLKALGPTSKDAVLVNGGDGYVCRVDPADPDLVYSEGEQGAIVRRNLRTGAGAAIRPKPIQGKPYRFNWNTPFILSHHDPKIFYVAGNYVFKSLNRGDDLKIISPEITLLKRGSASALSESPKNASVLWVGTDDGGLWVTQNGGDDWIEVGKRLPLPGQRWVASLEASRYKEGRCYVCVDAHRSDDDTPYIFVTEDFGQSWALLSATLPAFGSTRCVREDVVNEDLLYCGTEFAIFASIDRGAKWTKINNNLPTVAIHEVAVHASAGEIAVATHGRSLWILDVTALRQTTAQTLAKKVHLYKPATTILWHLKDDGAKPRFVGVNPPPGAPIYYTLGKHADKVSVKIFNTKGVVVGNMTGPTTAGLHRVLWTAEKDAVEPGEYRVVLNADEQELASEIRIELDPNVPANKDVEPDKLPLRK
jgi:photosystem II stability/assembly factor-like uncharacterized protein